MVRVKRTFRKKRRSKSKLVKKVMQIERRIGKPELKQFAWNYTGVAPISITTGNKFILNWNRGIPVTTALASAVDTTTPFVIGTGPYQRLGSSVMIHKAEFNINLGMNAAASNDLGVRLIIFIDKSPEGNTFSLSDILYDTGSGLGVMSPHKHATKREFRILHDKVYQCVQSGNATGGSTRSKYVHWKHTFKTPIEANYYPNNTTGTESTEAGIQEGALCAVIVCDVANGEASEIYSSILFTDA